MEIKGDAMTAAVARNIRRLRAVKGLNQGELAAKAGISRNAFRAIETGEAEPRVDNLQNIANALDVSLMDIFREVPELKTLRFRSKKTMSAQQRAEREDLVTRVALWLSDFNELEQMLQDRPASAVAGFERDDAGPQAVAAKAREILEIGEASPVSDICDELEDAGVKLGLKASNSPVFWGLSVGLADQGPAIVVNTRRDIPVERRIFSAAHELGHLLMHPHSYDGSIGEAEDNDPEEKEADEFASYFLMPQPAFEAKWKEYRGLHFVDRVLKIKRHFMVSYMTVLWRLIEMGEAQKSIWFLFGQLYRARMGKALVGRRTEPFPLAEPDFREDRMDYLVRRALENNAISTSRAAEILGISLADMRGRIKSWSAVA